MPEYATNPSNGQLPIIPVAPGPLRGLLPHAREGTTPPRDKWASLGYNNAVTHADAKAGAAPLLWPPARQNIFH
jgi:hypothetical protein